jgi:hypothetical protein
MEGLRELFEFSFAVHLFAEFDRFDGSLVIEVKHLGVLSQTVQNDSVDVHVEVDLWHEFMLVFDFIEINKGHKSKVFWVDFKVKLMSILVAVCRRQDLLVKEFTDFFYSKLFLEVDHDLLSLLSQVLQNILEHSHRGVLAQVSEMANVFFEEFGSLVLDTDIDQCEHELFQDDIVSLVSSVLEGSVHLLSSLLEVTFLTEFFSVLQGGFWQLPYVSLLGHD